MDGGDEKEGVVKNPGFIPLCKQGSKEHLLVFDHNVQTFLKYAQ